MTSNMYRTAWNRSRVKEEDSLVARFDSISAVGAF